MISKEEWHKLKEGDILISPNGEERTILRKTFNSGSMVTISSTRTHDGKTCYNRTDIYRKYKIKNNMDSNDVIKILEAIGHKDSKQYFIAYQCNNCGYNGVKGIAKGKTTDTASCQNCGCKGINKR